LSHAGVPMPPRRVTIPSLSSPPSAFIYGMASRRSRTILIRAPKRVEKHAVTRAASETEMNERARRGSLVADQDCP